MAYKKYINISQLLELTGRPYNEVLNLVQTGVLPAHKARKGHWRLNVDAVEDYFGIQINKPEKEEASTHLILNENHYKEVIERVCKAKSSIRIMTGDFMLFRLKTTNDQGTPFINYLINKAKSGVRVQIILSAPTPNVDEELKAFFRLKESMSYPFATRNCIRNHAKVVIIDDKIAYFGSANMTRAGLGQHRPGNFEVGMLTKDTAIVSSLKENFTKIWDGDYCANCHRANKCVEY